MDYADGTTALLAADMSIREPSTASKATAFGLKALASQYVQKPRFHPPIIDLDS
jgi:hypothetical protein